MSITSDINMSINNRLLYNGVMNKDIDMIRRAMDGVVNINQIYYTLLSGFKNEGYFEYYPHGDFGDRSGMSGIGMSGRSGRSRHTLLALACWIDSPIEIIQLLLENGAKIDKGHPSAIQVACIKGNALMLNLLLDYQDEYSFSEALLHMACLSANEDVVRLLFDRAFRMIQIDTGIGYVKTHLWYTIEYGHYNILALLIELFKKNDYYIPSEILIEVCKIGNKDIVKLLLDHGIVYDINMALLFACEMRHMDIINLLLDRGANINWKSSKDGLNALYSALINGHIDVFKLLLDRGANIHEKNRAGMNILHSASMQDQKNIVELLLGLGANIHDRDNQGLTALHLATLNGNKDIIELLLGQGANIHDTDNSGNNAIDIARQRHYTLRNYDSVIDTLERWSVSLSIVILQELRIYQYVGVDSFIDLFQY